jgi:hypothetical protein
VPQVVGAAAERGVLLGCGSHYKRGALGRVLVSGAVADPVVPGMDIGTEKTIQNRSALRTLRTLSADYECLPLKCSSPYSHDR